MLRNSIELDGMNLGLHRYSEDATMEHLFNPRYSALQNKTDTKASKAKSKES